MLFKAFLLLKNGKIASLWKHTSDGKGALCIYKVRLTRLVTGEVIGKISKFVGEDYIRSMPRFVNEP